MNPAVGPEIGLGIVESACVIYVMPKWNITGEAAHAFLQD